MLILRKRKISNNLTVHIKELEKGQQTKRKVSWRKEVRKITMEITDTETRETTEKKLTANFLKKINDIEKSLGRLRKGLK